MTENERRAALALGRCRYAPGTFAKRFAASISSFEPDRELTPRQRWALWNQVRHFRRQIPAEIVAMAEEYPDWRKVRYGERANTAWRQQARVAVEDAARDFQENQEAGTVTQLRAAISTAYPFGERAMHPYKMWLSEVKRFIGMVTGKPTITAPPHMGLEIDGQFACGWCGPEGDWCLACSAARAELASIERDPEWPAWLEAMDADPTAALVCGDWLEERGLSALAAVLRGSAREGVGTP